MERRFLVLYRNCKLKKQGERLAIETTGEIKSVPVRYVEAVVVMGKVSVSSDAIKLLLKYDVPVFFSSLWGSVKGSLISHKHMSRNNPRLIQYEAFQHRKLDVARYIVSAKISSIEKLFSCKLTKFKKDLERADSIESIMGVEGAVSRKMFEVFKTNIAGCALEFKGRTYRPPADPVNALLSLSYTFAYFLAFPLVSFLGYDPYLSFLHSKRGTHASFCSDLLEFVRPLITKEVEKVLLLDRFSVEDFRRYGKGYILRREKLNKFLNWFEGVKENVVYELKGSLVSLGEVMKG